MVRDVNTPFKLIRSFTPQLFSSILLIQSVSNRSDITAMSKYIQSMKLEQKVMKIGNRPDFGVRAEHMQMFGMPNQWSVMGMMTIPIVPWSSKMYSSETNPWAFKSSQWNRKTNHGTDGKKNVSRKTNHAQLRKRTISELHQKHYSCL
jgi:hypothetical protein